MAQNNNLTLHNTTALPRDICQALVITQGNSTQPLEGNPDVAGIGVVSSFIISAYISLAVAIVAYPRLLPESLLNDYDRLFIRARPSKSGKWFKALREGVMTFSDSQIIQGIAIMVAGFANIKTLTVYHWQLVCYMAWMSSNVHLTTLTFLRDYLNQHKVLRNFRIAGMIILLVLLIAAFVPTSTANWVLAVTQGFDNSKYPYDPATDNATYADAWYGLNFAQPVRCFWVEPFNGGGEQAFYMSSKLNPDAPFTYLILLSSYVWKISSLFRKQHRQTGHRNQAQEEGRIVSSRTEEADTPWFKRWVLKWLLKLAVTMARQAPQQHLSNIGKRFDMWYTAKSLLNKFVVRLILITYAGNLALYDFLASFLASIWALTLLLIWGTLEIVDIRHKSKLLPNVHSDENRWEFGQVLSIMLLAIPIIATLNHFFESPWKRYNQIRHPGEDDIELLQNHGNSYSSKPKAYQLVLNPADSQDPILKRESQITETASRDLAGRSSIDEDEAVGMATASQTHDHDTSLDPPDIETTHKSQPTDIPTSPSHPDTPLLQYILHTPQSQYDLNIISRDFFYKSRTFRSLLVLPNIICALGGIIVFFLEGKAATENPKKIQANGGISQFDEKGGVWITGLAALGLGFSVWVVWVAVAMFTTRLFRSSKAVQVSKNWG